MDNMFDEIVKVYSVPPRMGEDIDTKVTLQEVDDDNNYNIDLTSLVIPKKDPPLTSICNLCTHGSWRCIEQEVKDYCSMFNP
jgi:hypothetical protein